MIHTVTLNPAIDKLLFLDEFKKNITNRLSSVDDSIGGKGTHVSINLSSLGEKNNAYGIAHGKTGKQIISMLEAHANIDVKFIYKDSPESRTNFLLVEDTGDCCVLASRGVTVTKENMDEFLEVLKANLNKGDALVLSGDTSNCYDSRVYNLMLKELSDLNLKIYLDASGATLIDCLSASPYLIKPNQDELSQICGHDIETEEEIIAAIESLSSYNIDIIAVSLGGDGSIIKTPEGIYRVKSPAVTVKNTIGCGDCFLSGLIYGLEHDKPIEETLILATAISSATAESVYSIGFDMDRAKELMPLVGISKIK
ncbi:MAG: 1-phosphofructokinase family hexose kinase [Eubacterium sp.]|nr:1-phosphofructokinase family hexose kinase [Eubacterium sp.]